MKQLVLLLLSAILLSKTFSQSLIPNQLFANNGTYTQNLAGDAYMTNNAIALQADGKMLLGGYGLLRVFPDGAIDSSFGINGFADISIYSAVKSIQVLSDGKIIAVADYGINNGLAAARFNSNGFIDSSYGVNGKSAVTNNTANTYSTSSKLQPDGKLLITGMTELGFQFNHFMARLLPNGLPDNSFGFNGRVSFSLANDDDYAMSADLQSDGKIVVTGSRKLSDTSSSRLTVIRLHPNGQRDFSFNGGTGMFEYVSATPSGGEYGTRIAVIAGDKMMIAGGSNAKVLLARLLPTGAIDNTFGNAGLSFAQIGEFNPVTEMHILASGKILITGVSAFYQNPAGYDFAAFQFESNGAPDPGFGNGGKISITMPENEHCGGSILLSNGKFVLSGSRDAVNLVHLLRFNSAGTIDNSFGTNGVKYLLAQGTSDQIRNLLIQPDGKIIGIGSKSDGQINHSRFFVARYKNSGTPDSSFGTNGIFYHPDADGSPHSSILQSDGKIVVSVNKYTVGPGFYFSSGITRIHTNGTPDNSFATANNGVFYLDSVSHYGWGNNIALQPNGKIILGANLQFSPDEEIVLTRLQTNGTPDAGFGVNGVLVLPPDTALQYLAAIAVQADGKIVLTADQVINDSTYYYAVTRLLPDGMPDLSFGTNGTVTGSFGTGTNSTLTAVKITTDGKISISGSTYNNITSAPAVCIARFNPDGSLDTTLNTTGKVIYTYDMSNGDELQISGMAVNGDSSYFITGTLYNFTTGGPDKEFILHAGYTGILDSTVSSDGTGWHLYGGTPFSVNCNDIKITTDSSLITGGAIYSVNGHDNLLLNSWKKIDGKIYRFTGSGFWNNAANWSYGLLPPAILPEGSVIVIESTNCILNITQHIGTKGSITIKPGANLTIQGGLFITN